MKKIYSILLSIALSLSLISCNVTKDVLKVNDGDSDALTENNIQINTTADGHINKIMNDLCSEEYMSRVAGSEENTKATEYIKNFFISADIKPLDGTNYYYVIDNSPYFIDPSIASNSSRIPNEELNNVAGVIKGTKSDNAVFITAHFDHVKGLVGAIDNASGVSVMLEIAHKIYDATKDNPLDIDVVFVAFNAEETGLNGSLDFLSKHQDMYKNCYNINIDCVGNKNTFDLAMGCDDKDSEKLYNAMKKTFDTEGIAYTDDVYATRNGIKVGTSDHQIFRELGYPAVVLGDNGILDIVHTPNDTLEAIDYNQLENLTTSVAKFVVQNNNNMFN